MSHIRHMNERAREHVCPECETRKHKERFVESDEEGGCGGVEKEAWVTFYNSGSPFNSRLQREVGGWGRVPFSRNVMKPTPRRKWYLTTGRSFHEMVLDPIPQSLPVHFFGSRPQPPTSHCNKAIYRLESLRCKVGVYFMFRILYTICVDVLYRLEPRSLDWCIMYLRILSVRILCRLGSLGWHIIHDIYVCISYRLELTSLA